MKLHSPKLFLEINDSEYIFSVGDKDQENNFKVIYRYNASLEGIAKNCKVTDFEKTLNTIKKNIITIEQKFNLTFKEIILILDNSDCTFLNMTGFKKLNGSQILKENITYILNSLKSKIDLIENNKTILHIFNTKYLLDKKKIENLPIGLFGNFYSHELSFCLIDNNNFKNLNNVFNNCNLKIKKFFLKSFVEGSLTSKKNLNLGTFFQIKINEKNSQIFYFENDSLKFEQNFSFGTDLIIKDISKITSLNIKFVQKILKNINLSKKALKDEVIEKELFENENFTKIKKKLILDIAEARILEFSEIMLSKNINFSYYRKKNLTVFLTIKNKSHLNLFKESYELFFSQNKNLFVKFDENSSTDEFISRVNQLVDFGWKKEAIPVTRAKKSLLAKLFDALFN
jgi:cell division protein FtsA